MQSCLDSVSFLTGDIDSSILEQFLQLKTDNPHFTPTFLSIAAGQGVSKARARNESRRASVLATRLAVQLKPALTLVVICHCRGLSLLKPNIFSTTLHPLPREGTIIKLIQNIYTQIKPLISKVPSGHLGRAVLILLPLQMPAQAEVYRPCGALVASGDPPHCSSSGLRELPRVG